MMDDDNTNQRRRKSKWATSYSNITIAQTEQRLGFRIRSLKPIPVKTMIANTSKDLRKDTQAIEQTKAKVYDRIVEHLQVEGFPTEADPDFKEVNINYLVHSAISPILADYIRRTGRASVQLRCEKEIVSKDGETGGTEEFVVVDLISVGEEKYIFIVEAKRSSLGSAMKQCLLAMKDMSDNNGGGTVYGFVTTGDSWRMIRYDGAFQVTDKFEILFGSIEEDKETWMKDYSVLVDCIYTALSDVGIVID